MPPWITKSAFIRGYDCPVRLLYALERLPSNKADDEFLKMLAEGGFQFEALVRVAWPGERIRGNGFDLLVAHRRTLERLRALRDAGGGVLHEATLVHARLAARIDMLRVFGDCVELCEIKAKSFDGTADPDRADEVVASEDSGLVSGRTGAVRSEWLPYVADIAFQTIVAERSLREHGMGDLDVRPRLILANKNQACGEHDSFANLGFRPDPVDSSGRISDEDIVFNSPPPDGFRSPLIIEVDPAQAVECLRTRAAQSKSARWQSMTLDEMVDDALLLTAKGAGTPPEPERSWKCRDCEFRACGSSGDQEADRSGFARCWGNDAEHAAQLMSLYYGGGYQPAADRDSRQTWLTDILLERSTDRSFSIGNLPADQSSGTRAAVRNLQIQAERSGVTVMSEDFARRVRGELLPQTDVATLRFVDFETAGSCLPFAKGMHPYEIVAFQFSCHAIPFGSGGLTIAETSHHHWLNTRKGPADSILVDHREFIDELANAVGHDDGPVFHWASHERTVLQAIRKRLDRTTDKPRIEFIDRMMGLDGCPSRLIDMRPVAEGGIMSPHQRGRYSIKNVLPAACRKDRPWQILHSLMGTEVLGDSDPVDRDPYKLLPPIGGAPAPDDLTDGDSISSGTDAIRAFQQIRFGSVSSWTGLSRDDLITALTTYCTLDTAAMVAVWVWMVDEADCGPFPA